MRLTITLAGLAVTNVVAGFAYQIYVLTAIGPGSSTDALFGALAVPQVLLAVIGGALVQVLTPLLATEAAENLDREAWTGLHALALVFGPLAILLSITASVWVPWSVPGFPPDAKALAVVLARVHLTGMLFTGLTILLRAVWHARQQFVWTEVSPIVGTLCGIGLAVWGIPRWGAIAAAWSMTLSAFIQAALLAPVMGRYQGPDWNGAVVKEGWARIRPLLLGYSYLKTEQLVDRLLASMAPAGQLSIFYLAQQIYGSGSTVLNKAVLGPLVPRLARDVQSGAWESFRHLVRMRTLSMLAISSAGLIALLVVGRPVLAMALERGQFTEADVHLLWVMLIALGGVWLGSSGGVVLSSSFYTQGDTSTPVRIAAMGFTLAVVLKVVGLYVWGVVGLGLASSLYYLLNLAILCVILSRQLAARSALASDRTRDETLSV